MLTLRQKIGQMLIIGFDGTMISAHTDIFNWLNNESLGGVILFDYDMKTKTRNKNLINYQQIKQLIMLIIANQLAYITATEIIDMILLLISTGKIKEQRIDEAYQRILKLKK